MTIFCIRVRTDLRLQCDLWQVFVVRDFRMQLAFLCRPLPGRAQVGNLFGCIYECYRGPKKSCKIARTRVTILQGIVTKVHQCQSFQKPQQIYLRSPNIKLRRGPEGGARSGSHGGPQGRPRAPKCPKTAFEGHSGTPPPLWGDGV